MEYSANTSTQLAKLLIGRRKSLKLTQKQTGERVGILPKTISSMENSLETCTIKSFLKLLSALDLELVLRAKETPTASSELEW